MAYPFLIIFAIAPGLIWLLFFLRKDAHPESNRMILKIFFYGMAMAIPAIFIEIGFFQIVENELLKIFIGVALVEEFLKYLVVREKVLKNPELDEPLDIMLYMIIAALGFATLENLLIFLSPKTFFLNFGETFILAGFRFISATFLHALCSGVLGFFLALSFFETKERIKLTISGLALVTFLHGLYNFSIMVIEGYLRFLIPIIILISLAIAMSFGFQKIKKLASVCKI